MFLIAGLGSRMKDLGTREGRCPACGSGGLHITKESATVSLFFIPLASFNAKYYATCGGCASVMALEKSAGKRIERQPGCEISPHELNIIRNLNGPRCKSCRRRIYPGQSFCPGCGERV